MGNECLGKRINEFLRKSESLFWTKINRCKREDFSKGEDVRDKARTLLINVEIKRITEWEWR